MIAITILWLVLLLTGGNATTTNPCTEDESMVQYDKDTIVCLHVEGDGWRVA